MLNKESAATPAEEPMPIHAGGVLYLSPVPVTPAEASTPAPHAQPWGHVGITNTQSAEEVPEKYEGTYVPPELSLPNQRERGAISVYAVLQLELISRTCR